MHRCTDSSYATDKGIGIVLAVEALCEDWVKRRFTTEKLLAMAEVCPVHNVLRPYLDSIV